jgi:Flp pilus assembly protein TadD
MYRSQILPIQNSLKAKFPLIYICGLLAIAAVLSFATAVSAQFERDFGRATLNVTVYTADGELLSVPAHIVLSSEDSLVAIQQTTCNNGIATFNSVPSGDYVVTVQVPGFKDGSAEIELFEGAQANASVTLQTSPDPSTDVGAMGTLLAPKAREDLTQGLAAIDTQKFDDAQKHLEAAYKLAPGDANVNSALGQLYLAEKNLPEAEHYVDRATSLGPDNFNALIDAGELGILQQNPAAAEGPLEHAVDVAPRSKFAHWLLGITYFDLGLYEKCRSEALAVIKINKSTATDGAFLLGQSLAALGRTTEAVDTLKKFVDQVPHDVYTEDAKTLISKLQGQPAVETSSAPSTAEVASR